MNSLHLQQRTALAQRVVAYVQLSATSDPVLFTAMLDHALAAAAAPPDLVTPDARELLLRASLGIPRRVSHLLRIALILADERGHGPIDVPIVNTATVLLHLDPPASRCLAADQTPCGSRSKITGITRPDTGVEVVARPVVNDGQDLAAAASDEMLEESRKVWINGIMFTSSRTEMETVQ